MSTWTVWPACMGFLAWFGLAGCANTDWERAFYQGARQGNAQCQIQRKPADPPCAELLDFDRYERERAKARNRTSEEQVP